MSTPKTAADNAKDQFWSVVRDYLRAFHKLTPGVGARKANLLRKKLETLSNETIELFYHSEPFDVALRHRRAAIECKTTSESIPPNPRRQTRLHSFRATAT